MSSLPTPTCNVPPHPVSLPEIGVATWLLYIDLLFEVNIEGGMI